MDVIHLSRAAVDKLSFVDHTAASVDEIAIVGEIAFVDGRL